MDGVHVGVLAGDFATLRPLSINDVSDLLSAANEERSTYNFTTVPSTSVQMETTVLSLLAEHASGGCVPLVTTDTSTGEVLGMTRFLSLRWWDERDAPSAVEIGGTFLAARAQGTRINPEAKLLMLTHAFEVWRVQRVDLKTDERNARSRGAIEALGASFEGVLRHWQPSLVDGEEGKARNSAMYSILPNEWLGVKGRLQQRLVA